MRVLSVLFFATSVFAYSFFSCAATRAPRTENERSLLYWRYLCEGQAQKEIRSDALTVSGPGSKVELHCMNQGWSVTSLGDRIVEVVEDAKK